MATLFGSRSSPTDGGTLTTSPVTITPPGSMVAGQLVVVGIIGKTNLPGVTINNAGGQNWIDEGLFTASTNRHIHVFWCIYDGTWNANPSWAITTISNAVTGLMRVWTPTSGFAWHATDLDAEIVLTNGAAPLTPFDFTLTGVTRSSVRTVALGFSMSTSNNVLAVQTAGWGSLVVDNQGGNDLATVVFDRAYTAAGATGDVVIRQTFGTAQAWMGVVMAFKETTTVSGVSLSNTAEGGSDNTTVTQANSGGASGNAWQTASIAGIVTFDNERLLPYTTFANTMSYKIAKTVSPSHTLGWNNTVIGTTHDELFFRAYFFFNAWPVDSEYIAIIYNGPTFLGGIVLGATGTMFIVDLNGTSLDATGAGLIAPQMWWRIEWRLKRTGQEIEARIYPGHSVTPLDTIISPTAILGNANPDGFRIGAVGISEITMWFDDIALSSTNWVGPSGVDRRIMVVLDG